MYYSMINFYEPRTYFALYNHIHSNKTKDNVFSYKMLLMKIESKSLRKSVTKDISWLV